MAIKTDTNSLKFHSGRGDPKGFAKTNEEVLHEEAESMEELAEGVNPGEKANDMGAKPIYATGEETPFHTGRGPGRGHGKE